MSPVLRGGLLVVGSSACVALDTIVARVVMEEINPFVLVFFRNAFGLLFMLPWLLRVGTRGLATHKPAIHVLRALAKIVAFIAFFWGLTRIPVADATAIVFATPLFAAAGAALWLGESLRGGRLAAILLGFLGVLVIVRPGLQVLDAAALACVAAALGHALVGLCVKHLSRHDPPNTIIALNLLLSVPLALLLALPFWTTPDAPMLLLMALQGLLGLGSQLFITRAMRLADASVMMPIDFVRLPMVAALAFAAFGELADAWTWAGAAIIFCATVLLLRAGTTRALAGPGPQER
ncbi:DMT family transporter [Marinimicrococcus flavescens]|uniref:DMT family transporter n=1 Tax=Marinimicrococcus flavescens TaxID=3031815 RepID=A0AAP3XSA2_9PROT|nr:DMT family transporter [Marinimicrococcus flavescens]